MGKRSLQSRVIYIKYIKWARNPEIVSFRPHFFISESTEGRPIWRIKFDTRICPVDSLASLLSLCFLPSNRRNKCSATRRKMIPKYNADLGKL